MFQIIVTDIGPTVYRDNTHDSVIWKRLKLEREQLLDLSTNFRTVSGELLYNRAMSEYHVIPKKIIIANGLDIHSYSENELIEVKGNGGTTIDHYFYDHLVIKEILMTEVIKEYEKGLGLVKLISKDISSNGELLAYMEYRLLALRHLFNTMTYHYYTNEMKGKPDFIEMVRDEIAYLNSVKDFRVSDTGFGYTNQGTPIFFISSLIGVDIDGKSIQKSLNYYIELDYMQIVPDLAQANEIVVRSRDIRRKLEYIV